MFSKNLKYYRLKNSMTKSELAKRINVTAMSITNYESGNRFPNMEMIKQLAHGLGVSVSDFLAIRNKNLKFDHGKFRKNSSLTGTEQEYIRESVEEYFNRFMTILKYWEEKFYRRRLQPTCLSLLLS